MRGTCDDHGEERAPAIGFNFVYPSCPRKALKLRLWQQ